MLLKEKVAIITGASGALGRETLRVFLAEGAKIAGCDVVEPEMTDLADAVAHGDCMIMRFDVTAERDVAEMVAHTLDHFGRVDVLVNVVGGWKGGIPLHRTSVEDWDGMLTLNLKSAFLCSRAVLPHMLERRSGRILNISSRTAVQPAANQVAYNASKAGIIALTQGLAEEVKQQGITVNCVLPSVLNTEANRKAIPTGDFDRWVKPRDIASVLAFLASDAASQLTGAAVPVYGRA